MNEKAINGRERGADDLITTQEMSRILEMTNVNTTIVPHPQSNVQGQFAFNQQKILTQAPKSPLFKMP